MKKFAVLLIVLLQLNAVAQSRYTRADTLRGSITKERAWWNVLHYDLHVSFNPVERSIEGWNNISYQIIKPATSMQIDLQTPMQIDSVIQDGKRREFVRDGNAWFITLNADQQAGTTRELSVYYSGNPHVSKQPPWDGGVVWSKDRQGNPWITVACQGFGASVWYPNKDHQSDEPDSAAIHITAPDSLVAVSNGRLQAKTQASNGNSTWHWAVKNPINNYNLVPYIGKYIDIHEIYIGEKGTLDVTYWVMPDRKDKAETHLRDQTQKTLKNLEYWFGPYPFYEDGFQMIETPHLGMEHQSGIAYGNGYQYGYLGRDLSQSGWGLKWDFIVVHETAHEWYGNNITTKDLADMWVHEGFGNYSETLFTESEFGKQAGTEYVVGTRKGIRNDQPVIPSAYNVNQEGSGDMYPKGGNMIHTIRQIMNNDEKFRMMLRDMNQTFWHQTVTTVQIEDFISLRVGRSLSKVFDQYLRDTKIPEFSWSFEPKGKSGTITYQWKNCIDGFDMPLKVMLNGKGVWLYPGTSPQQLKVKGNPAQRIADVNFYITENASIPVKILRQD
jgi:aminopeptidase N